MNAVALLKYFVSLSKEVRPKDKGISKGTELVEEEKEGRKQAKTRKERNEESKNE